MLSKTLGHQGIAQIVRCIDLEGDSACLLGEDWEFLHVNPAWVRFARDNGGGPCNTEALIGRSYLSFVGDPAVRTVLESIQVHAASGEAFTLYGECNGPGVQRKLASHFVPVQRGDFRGTAVLHLTLSEVRAGEAPAPVAAPGDDDAELCSSCNRIRRPGETRWRHVVPTRRGAARLSSVYCSTCEGLISWAARPGSLGARS